MPKTIILPTGHICLISAKDYDWALQFKWYVNKAVDGRMYVCRYANDKRIYMHRELTECPPHMVVDHKDCNTFNNTRTNLRVCCQRSNMRNRTTCNKTGFKGVTYDARYKRYQARITVERDSELHLGYYPSADDAALAYDKAALVFFGEFAWLNFPIQQEEENDERYEIPF